MIHSLKCVVQHHNDVYFLVPAPHKDRLTNCVIPIGNPKSDCIWTSLWAYAMPMDEDPEYWLEVYSESSFHHGIPAVVCQVTVLARPDTERVSARGIRR